MQDNFAEIAMLAEGAPSLMTTDDALIGLRRLGLDDFGNLLFNLPSDRYPRLSALLPRMPTPEVQIRWTGTNGTELLKRSVVFIRSAVYNYNKITSSDLADAKILDYGCGWGRLARLFYYFVATTSIYGVDPLGDSIEECRIGGLGDNFRLSEFHPMTLPIPQNHFDFVYSFSVFTHTSERATLSALGAIHRAMKLGGVLCITIRPIEYWDAGASPATAEDILLLKRKHERDGFAFYPHTRFDAGGDASYGDTSMTLDWLSKHAPHFEILTVDRSLDDPLQPYIYLKAV